MYHPTDRITHTTAFIVEHWLEREIVQWAHHKGSIRRPIAPCANFLTTALQRIMKLCVCVCVCACVCVRVCVCVGSLVFSSEVNHLINLDLNKKHARIKHQTCCHGKQKTFGFSICLSRCLYLCVGFLHHRISLHTFLFTVGRRS